MALHEPQFVFADAINDVRNLDELRDFNRYLRRSDFDDRAKSETYLGGRVKDNFSDGYFNGSDAYSDDFGPSIEQSIEVYKKRARTYASEISELFCISVNSQARSNSSLTSDHYTFTIPRNESLSMPSTDLAPKSACSTEIPKIFTSNELNCSAIFNGEVEIEKENGQKENGVFTIIPDAGFVGVAQLTISLMSEAYTSQPDVWVLCDRLRGLTLTATVTINVI